MAVMAVAGMVLDSSPAAAADADSGAWLVFSATGGLGTGGNWLYAVDAQARYLDIGEGATQYVIRPGLGYSFGGGRSLWAGYGRFITEVNSGTRATEDRWWQQFDWTARSRKDSALTMRLRLEQRFVSVGDDMGLVLRYRLRYARRFSESSLYEFVASAEPFVKLRDTDWAGDAGIAQNRLFLGARRSLGPRFSLEGGYMNQYVWLDGRENRSEHVLVLHLQGRF